VAQKTLCRAFEPSQKTVGRHPRRSSAAPADRLREGVGLTQAALLGMGSAGDMAARMMIGAI